MKCQNCGQDIPDERLAILPRTKTCLLCSEVKPVLGFSVFSHKTAGEILTVNPDKLEHLRLATRAHRRSR